MSTEPTTPPPAPDALTTNLASSAPAPSSPVTARRAGDATAAEDHERLAVALHPALDRFAGEWSAAVTSLFRGEDERPPEANDVEPARAAGDVRWDPAWTAAAVLRPRRVELPAGCRAVGPQEDEDEHDVDVLDEALFMSRFGREIRSRVLADTRLRERRQGDGPYHPKRWRSSNTPHDGGKGSGPNGQCTICLEPLVDTSADSNGAGDIATCPCMHKFHVRCIKSWLRVKQACPVCCSKCTHRQLLVD